MNYNHSQQSKCSFPAPYTRSVESPRRGLTPTPSWKQCSLSIGIILMAVLSGCRSQPTSVSLSSGPVGGFYNRLGTHIHSSTQESVGLMVQNLDSQGSRQNLERLLNRQVDFALVQLDVAHEAMRQEKIQAIATLANEYVHIITQKNVQELKTFADLQGKRVSLGTPGSGIRFTANQLIQADRLTVQTDESGLDDAFKKLRAKQVDALIYVGSVGASEKLRQQLANNPIFKLIPIQGGLINNLSVLNPGSYQPGVLAVGTYVSRPATPDREIPTLSTATVLVTRPDVTRQKVGLVTWSILSKARTYSEFYPEMQGGNAAELLRRGLFYIHPGAEEVYEQGDPRAALIRYWENNHDLQAGVFILTASSIVGLLIRHWRRQRSKKILAVATSRINELKELLPEQPQQALIGIEELGQEHRLWFIDGAVTSEIYEQLVQRTQTFADRCRTMLADQRRSFVMDTLLLLDEWQATLQSDPEGALQKLSQIKQQYREMLLAGQVDIEAYIELMELTLISVMTLLPTTFTQRAGNFNHNQTIHDDRTTHQNDGTDTVKPAIDGTTSNEAALNSDHTTA